MAHVANDDWLIGQLVVVSHAWRGDRLWHDMQTEAQDRIGAALRAMYADLLHQPLSPQLGKFVRQIETRLGISRHAG